MTRFVVDLGDVALSPVKQAEIATSVQQAVLNHLAQFENVIEQNFVLFPRHILGIIFRPELSEFVKTTDKTGN